MLSQPPLRIHPEGEEKDATILALFRVVPKLDRVSVCDALVERLVLVRGTADAGGEDVDGELLPFDTHRAIHMVLSTWAIKLL